MSQHIIEPLLSQQAELIVEGQVFADTHLRDCMLTDVKSMSDDTKRTILCTMLKMHKEIADYCGDLDVSLKSIEEIAKNTESWYVILDAGSTRDIRGVRYHYKANWETSHGVEVVVINGNQVRFVGNCGYFSTLEGLMNGDDDEFNYL